MTNEETRQQPAGDGSVGRTQPLGEPNARRGVEPTAQRKHDFAQVLRHIIRQENLAEFQQYQHGLEKEVPTLTAEQLELLRVVTENLRDPESFREVDGTLSKSGLTLSDEELWMLAEVARARAPDVQRAEFAAADARVTNNESLPPQTVFEGAIQEPDLGEMDAIPTPKVYEGDYRSLVPNDGRPEVRPEGFKGLMGRASTATFRILGFERKDHNSLAPIIWKYVGALLLVALCAGIFIVPGLIVEGADPPERVAAEQMRLTLARDDDFVSLDSARQPHVGITGSVNNAVAASGPDTAEPVRSAADLLFNARQMNAQYRYEDAAASYEAYLKQNQNDVAARIELIRVYVRLHKQYLIRKHCVRALKYQPNSEQTKEILQMFQQS